MLQILVRIATCVTAIVTTLRAGSRALYLYRHNGTLGVMDGPIIQYQCTNDTSVNMFDVSQGFSLAVKVGLATMPPKAVHDGETLESTSAFDYSNATTRSLTWFHDVIQSTRDIVSEITKLSRDICLESSWRKSPSIAFRKAMLHDGEYIGQCCDRHGQRIDFLAERNISYILSSPLPNSRHKKRIYANITSYASEAFSDLRYRFGIDDDEFRQALANGGPFVSFQSNSKGAARAGGVFFFSRNGAFMIKSIKKAEAKTLLAFLPEYYKHMRRYNKRSLLTRFCGMYRVHLSDVSIRNERKFFRKAKGDNDFIFVVMNSVYPAESSLFISERFDLKGSTVGRECSQDEKTRKGSDAVLKDLDLAKEVDVMRTISNLDCSPTFGLHIGARLKSSLMSQLRKDVKFLVKCGVMDYSLLVGVVDMCQKKSPNMLPSDSIQLISNTSVLPDSGYTKSLQIKESNRIKSFFGYSFQTVIAPPTFVLRKVHRLFESTISSILTLPLPYYGAGVCGVDGGSLSILPGSRRGHRCVYYFGLIDFLQPWTMKKVIEREVKGFAGYDITAISCVDPNEYGSRFLDFMNAHIT